jgi:predicted metal-dependent enzyme (double-stranded beta helix superfamily)
MGYARLLIVKENAMGFDRDQFIADCIAAAAETTPEPAIGELVAAAVSEPGALLRELGEPAEAGVQRIHVSDTLTIINVIWGPRMTLMPHNHEMWATIGVYAGREDNIFWRRRVNDDDDRGLIEAAGARSMGVGEAMPLGRDIIHSVTNPVPRLSGAIHVYGGDFFATERSEWEPETLEERPYDIEKNMKYFIESNALLTRT